jgi:citrate synthase
MADMNWSTAIAEVHTDDVVIRGHRLSELVGSVSYADMAFLLIRGDQASPAERSMLDAILVCLADHGISPTTIVARTLTSCGTPIQAAMAGAMLSVADHHGGSGEEVGAILAEIIQAAGDGQDATIVAAVCDEIVLTRRAARRQIPGFGHPQHTGGDPRAIQLLGLAASLGVAGTHCDALDALGAALERATGRENLRRANVTGALAAILLDLGFPWQSIRGIVIAARSLGLTAHIVEELQQGNKWRHAPADTVQYTGEPAR